MPKAKTKRAAAKRFRITPTGKVMHYRASRSHLLRKKRPKRKRHLQHPKLMAPGDARRARRMLQAS